MLQSDYHHWHHFWKTPVAVKGMFSKIYPCYIDKKVYLVAKPG